MGTFVLAGLIIGLIAGMAIQRFRTAYQSWRGAIAAVPKARSAAAATGREAFIWVAVTVVVLLVVTRGGG